MKVVVPKAIGVGNFPAYPTHAKGYQNIYGSAVWSAVTAYAIGNKVIVDALFSEFQCIAANTNIPPVVAGNANWVRIGASNPWKPFDSIVSSPSYGYTGAVQLLDRMYYTLIGLGKFSTVCVLQTDAAWVKVDYTDSLGTTFSLRIYAVDTTAVTDALSYFFDVPQYRRDFIFDEIDGWGLTAASELIITVSNDFTGTAVAVGEIVVGFAYDIGKCHGGPKLELVDYSKKATNAYGEVGIVKRPYSFQGNFSIEIATSKRNTVQNLIAQLRATVCVWFPTSDDANNGLVIYGFEKSFGINYETKERAYADLEIEGLT